MPYVLCIKLDIICIHYTCCFIILYRYQVYTCRAFRPGIMKWALYWDRENTHINFFLLLNMKNLFFTQNHDTFSFKSCIFGSFYFKDRFYFELRSWSVNHIYLGAWIHHISIIGISWYQILTVLYRIIFCWVYWVNIKMEKTENLESCQTKIAIPLRYGIWEISSYTKSVFCKW